MKKNIITIDCTNIKTLDDFYFNCAVAKLNASNISEEELAEVLDEAKNIGREEFIDKYLFTPESAVFMDEGGRIINIWIGREEFFPQPKRKSLLKRVWHWLIGKK